jgi:hypothetical protein
VDPRPGTLIRYAGAADVSWRNGGGRTRELAAGPGWRLSVATIAGAGEFSHFPGRDRTLVVGRGRLALSIGPRWQVLAEGDVADFPGEEPVRADPVGGPVVAVNVMVDRTWGAARVDVVRLDGAAPAADAVVLLAGSATVEGVRLGPFDAVRSPVPGSVCGAGASVVVVWLQEGQS